MSWLTKAITVGLVILLVGCSVSPIKQAKRYEAEGEWLKAVNSYRTAQEKRPNDIGVRSQLRQAELRAAESYYHRGLRALAANNVDGAIVQFEHGLVAMPQNEKLLIVLKDAIARKEAEQLYRRAMRNIEIRNYREASELLEQALQRSPGFQPAREEVGRVRAQMQKGTEREFALTSDDPIELNFQQTDLRTAFGFLANAFGINVIFDEAVRDTPVTVYAKDVSFRQALNLMLSTTRTFYKRVGDNTILVAPDTRDKRGQYEDYIIQTFQLTNAMANEVANVLRGILSLQKVVVDERLNVLTIRDTEEGLALAERIIANVDAKPAEMILEVEILEVNRTKSEQLGFDFGSVINTEFPDVRVSGSFTEAFRGGAVTLPSVSFRYFKQNVDAKTLANPQLRVINGRSATIHIGDRVPLRASTIQDATGQTRTTFEYTDIGIRLALQPQIQLDNSTVVQMGLEVSSLGQNLGTTAEPAYSIGTRNADTVMLLNDGETAILGGLIRDEDRKTRVRVPGLGDIPVIGMLFTAKEDSVVRTDVLLTITPHVIRPWQLTLPGGSTIYSGTAETYSIASRLGDRTQDPFIATNRVGPALPSLVSYIPTFEFGRSVYGALTTDELITIELVGRNLRQDGIAPIDLHYDPALLEYVDFHRTSAVRRGTKTDLSEGVISLSAHIKGNDFGDPTVLGQFIFKPRRTGVAELSMTGYRIWYGSGESYEANTHPARIIID